MHWDFLSSDPYYRPLPSLPHSKIQSFNKKKETDSVKLRGQKKKSHKQTMIVVAQGKKRPPTQNSKLRNHFAISIGHKCPFFLLQNVQRRIPCPTP